MKLLCPILFFATSMVVVFTRDYSNMEMLNAVCLAHVYKSDRAAAKELSGGPFGRNRNTQSPDHKTIANWRKNLEDIGCFLGRPRSGRPVVVGNEDNFLKIKELLDENSKLSIREIQSITDINRCTIHRLLKSHKYKAYKSVVVQKLYSGDNTKRKNFCDWLLEKVNEDPYFHRRIYFSDEAVFHVSGNINRHNDHHWAIENPNIPQERSNNQQRLIVWALIGYTGVERYEIFERTVKTGVYRNILDNHVVPFFTRRGRSHLWFQQDGAPAHYALSNRELLDNTIGSQWIGRGGPVPWLPRSPDLTVCDFFLWGFLKSKVYSREIRNLDELRSRIIEEIENIPIDFIRKSVDSVIKRCEKCNEYNGGIFEMFLDKDAKVESEDEDEDEGDYDYENEGESEDEENEV